MFDDGSLVRYRVSWGTKPRYAMMVELTENYGDMGKIVHALRRALLVAGLSACVDGLDSRAGIQDCSNPEWINATGGESESHV